jgi:diadenosine tetraphosphate (Ap4A) HIT family hydrolase
MLSEEEAKKIKEQIIKQIDSWNVSKEQKTQAKEQIENLKSEELEDFLIKNKLIKTQAGEENQDKKEEVKETAPEQCPFCLIIEGKLPSYKIDENKDSIAVLEINPLSKGHSIAIPKKHQPIEKISSKALSLSKKVASRIKTRLKAKDISIQSATAFGHGIINIIPLYENEKLERKKAEEAELKELQEKLTARKPKTTIIKEKKGKQLEKAPVRIP